MAARTALAALAVSALAFAASAQAEQRGVAVDIRAGALPSALQDLARQTGMELLYDRAIVRGARTAGAHGRLTGEAALRQLLAGTGLTMRRSGSGAWLIERQLHATAASAATPLPPPELEAPEILVVGSRTQNFDIRRREDDVQPYQVTTGEEVVRAHRDNVDQYFATRITGNTEVVPVALRNTGETRSEIDLRGLGPDGTLVLVDGRRLPSIPQDVLSFAQPDLNAIPLHAIERIETLTGTAGGIYGFGALGGVVNVVLRRDYRGAEVHVTGGLSTRGDAARLDLEARLGFTPDGGRTEMMIYVSRATGVPLLVGQRDFTYRDLVDTVHFAPDLFISNWPDLNAVTVYSLPQGENLVFRPEYGGGALSSDHTYLPTGFAGTQADLVAALTAHAGQLEVHQTNGAKHDGLSSTGRTEALIANIRHRFGADVEAYLDAVVLRNHGTYARHASYGFQILFASSPTNPFNQNVFVTFPVPEENVTQRARFDSARYTAGIVAGLPLGWRGTAEATLGRLNTSSLDTLENYAADSFDPPQVNPFGNWDQLQAAAVASLSNGRFGGSARNHYDEESVRLAGPLFRTAAGPATLTLLAERRRESIPISTSFTYIELIAPDVSHSETASRALDTRSVSAELRSRLLGDEAFPLLRNLEIQLALRHDRQSVDFSRDSGTLDDSQRVRTRFTGTTFTAGAKVSPLPWLTLRGSYATGEQPPPLVDLIDSDTQSFIIIAHDPKRGGNFPGLDSFQAFEQKSGGSPDLTTSRATTLSFGGFVEPFGLAGPRLSLDYSRIRRSRDFYVPDDQTILDHEDYWPERVVRAPLTDADRALGYTGGRIILFDDRGLNGAGRVVETIDARFDWPFHALGGRLRLYGNATWQLRNVERRLFVPDIERVGWNSGPLGWRANGGADWTIGATTVGANLQYFSRYRLTSQELPDYINDLVVAVQGTAWIPAQTYVDLYASRRFRMGGIGSPYALDVDFGIVNLLDSSPPREAGAVGGGSYSRYGDPRRRRVELVLSASF